ncbi:hypothetical protein [Aurantivibrio infirmus]
MKEITLNPFDYRCKTSGFEIPPLYSEYQEAIKSFGRLNEKSQNIFCKILWEAASKPLKGQRDRFWTEMTEILNIRIERNHECCLSR